MNVSGWLVLFTVQNRRLIEARVVLTTVARSSSHARTYQERRRHAWIAAVRGKQILENAVAARQSHGRIGIEQVGKVVVGLLAGKAGKLLGDFRSIVRTGGGPKGHGQRQDTAGFADQSAGRIRLHFVQLQGNLGCPTETRLLQLPQRAETHVAVFFGLFIGGSCCCCCCCCCCRRRRPTETVPARKNTRRTTERGHDGRGKQTGNLRQQWWFHVHVQIGQQLSCLRCLVFLRCGFGWLRRKEIGEFKGKCIAVVGQAQQ